MAEGGKYGGWLCNSGHAVIESIIQTIWLLCSHQFNLPLRFGGRRVAEPPRLDIHVTVGGKPVNEWQGIPAPGPRRVEVIIIPDEGFKTFLPKDARYRVSEWEVTLARGSRPVKTKKVNASKATLSDFTFLAQPGDRIVIEVKFE